MIVYLATRATMYTIQDSLPFFPEDLREKFRVIKYSSLLDAKRLPVATYIFSDIERLPRTARILAARAWSVLEQSGAPVRLLNHPIRAMRRYELLRCLYQNKLNSFNVHRAIDPTSKIRFPVFLRVTNDHNGARSDLIHNPAILESELGRLEDSGIPSNDMLIVEFCDTSDERGIYRKYDAFVVQGNVVPTDAYFSRQWMLKWHTSRDFGESPVPDEAFTAEELAHLQNTHDHEHLRQVARLANIDYGRVDYARQGDRIQVWEINTNPDLSMAKICADEVRATPYGSQVVPMLLEAVFAMFRSLDNDFDPRVGIPVDFGNDFVRSRPMA